MILKCEIYNLNEAGGGSAPRSETDPEQKWSSSEWLQKGKM